MRAILIAAILMAMATTVSAQTYEQRLGPVTVGPVHVAPVRELPILTWGGEAPHFLGNGGVTTARGSIYDQLGLKVTLVNGDNFDKQVKEYLTGKNPYLRGTPRMVAAASGLLNKDPRTRPVMFLQETYSLGDHIVSREEVRTLNDLKGKKIAIQLPIGPHLDLLQDSLLAAQLTLRDVTLVAATDITGDNGPAALFRKDKSIAACCVITPDMLGLCSGVDKVGTGTEGTVKGSHVLNSTAVMSKSIVDGLWVRQDYFNTAAGKAETEKIVVAYLKATEQLLKEKDAYRDGQGNSPAYVNTMKLMQRFYGEAVLPTIENDVHGLISDAAFVRIPGNEVFFKDPNNLVGFEAKLKAGSDFTQQLGYAVGPVSYDKAAWDYRKISSAAGVAYVEPVLSQGKVNAEAIDFTEIDGNVIVSFEVQFDAETESFDAARYAAEFDRIAQNAALFSRGAVVVRGNSDTFLLVKEFFRAAKAKGLITGTSGNYKFKGKALDLTKTGEIVAAIQTENLSGLRDDKGAIEDPRAIASAAKRLSEQRATAVKNAIQKYLQEKGVMLDLSQIQPYGAGVESPKYPRPRSAEEMAANRRVEFLVVRTSAEAVNTEEFDFDK